MPPTTKCSCTQQEVLVKMQETIISIGDLSKELKIRNEYSLEHDNKVDEMLVKINHTVGCYGQQLDYVYPVVKRLDKNDSISIGETNKLFYKKALIIGIIVLVGLLSSVFYTQYNLLSALSNMAQKIP